METLKQYFLLIVFFFSAMGIAAPISGGIEVPATEFKNPEYVDIKGLPAGAEGTKISTEEPFISRDGLFLFFNSAQHENNKDLHYAKLINKLWVYQGELGPNVNTAKEVQGNPTMDAQNHFYFIDSGAKPMAMKAIFFPHNGKLASVRDLEGLPVKDVKLFRQKVHGNIGVEVSEDGNEMFFSRATWDLNVISLGKLLAVDIFLARKKEGRYVYDEIEANRIMKNINTQDLEYAASISSNGNELFFTRLGLDDYNTGKIRSVIMRTTRTTLSEPFGKPEVVRAIGNSDFVEGPAISPDGKELYYHKHEGKKFRLYKVMR